MEECTPPCAVNQHTECACDLATRYGTLQLAVPHHHGCGGLGHQSDLSVGRTLVRRSIESMGPLRPIDESVRGPDRRIRSYLDLGHGFNWM